MPFEQDVPLNMMDISKPVQLVV